MRLHPQHDTTQNYLRTGLLQVGNGTHLTFDCDELMSLFLNDNIDSCNSNSECCERDSANEQSMDQTIENNALSHHGSN